MRKAGVPTKTLSVLLLACFASQADAKTVSQTLVAEHAIAQQGLGLGLSSTSFWTQLVLLIYPGFLPQNSCSALSSSGQRGGAIDVLSFQNGKKKFSTTANFYFDSGCKKPYIAASSKYVAAAKSKDTKGTIHAAYTGVTGFALGTYDVNVDLVQKSSNDFQVWGAGTFKVSKNTAASIGFACELHIVSNAGSRSDPAIPCTYALAQNFPSLKQSLAFVTTLKLKGTPSGSIDPVKFEGEQSQTVTSPNDLTVVSPAAYKLAISGSQQTTYGSAAPQGSSANFSLFPPKPTKWSITDTAHDIAFSTAVTDEKTRGSKGAITQISTGTTLATFTVDQSGTGSIKYSDGSTAAITSWLLSN
jgi:hypothetical protein